jgi:arginase family enzyme
MALGLDPLELLSVIDYGDVEVAPADLQRSPDALERRLRETLAAGAVPLVLGSDHSLSLPAMRVLAERYGADGAGTGDFDWMRGEGFRWHTMDEISQRGLAAVMDQAVEAVAAAAPAHT